MFTTLVHANILFDFICAPLNERIYSTLDTHFRCASVSK